MKGVTNMFISKDGLAIFWFMVACGCIAGTAWYLHGLAIEGRGRMLFVPVEQYDLYLDREMSTQGLDESADFFTRLIMETALNRAPRGLVNAERLGLMFIGDGYDLVLKDVEENRREFRSKQIHQMVELGKVNIVHHPDGSAITSTAGQVIRVIVDPNLNETIVQAFWVDATLELRRNQNLRDNKRFMYVCSDISFTMKEMAPPEKKSS
ncbi:MAG TPA: hypothetical protein VGE29_17695 [Prosthecobacter sp.]